MNNRASGCAGMKNDEWVADTGLPIHNRLGRQTICYTLSMAEPPKRRAWFQLHLSTCVVLMVVAGLVLWLNIYMASISPVTINGRQMHYILGIPFPVSPHHPGWEVGLLNFVFWTALLAGLGLALERRGLRRAASSLRKSAILNEMDELSDQVNDDSSPWWIRYLHAGAISACAFGAMLLVSLIKGDPITWNTPIGLWHLLAMAYGAIGYLLALRLWRVKRSARRLQKPANTNES